MAGVTRGRKRANESANNKDEPISKKRKLPRKKPAKKTTPETNGKGSANHTGKQRKKSSLVKKVRNGVEENGVSTKQSKNSPAKKSPAKKSLAKKGLKSSKEVSNSSPPTPRKPPRFSWIEAGTLAGHGRPTVHGHVQYLVDHGFKYIVTLTQNQPRTLREFLGGLEWIHIPVQDEKPPSLEQIQIFCEAVSKASAENVAISVHCAWGRGRTGTMLACYLAQHNKLSAEDAIKKIREIRPGSIDTEVQAGAVHGWVDSL